MEGRRRAEQGRGHAPGPQERGAQRGSGPKRRRPLVPARSPALRFPRSCPWPGRPGWGPGPRDAHRPEPLCSPLSCCPGAKVTVTEGAEVWGEEGNDWASRVPRLGHWGGVGPEGRGLGAEGSRPGWGLTVTPVESRASRVFTNTLQAAPRARPLPPVRPTPGEGPSF